MKSNTSERIEEIRKRIKTGDYKDAAEKHELHKQRWLLQKMLDGIILPNMSMSESNLTSE